MDIGRKAGRYQRLFEQARSLIMGKCPDPVARMATISALLYHKFDHFFWVGFYLLKEDDLIVGPYQGPVACMLLPRHQGVCWAGVLRTETVVVPDVHDFPGHVACDARSQSEIVVPVYDRNENIVAVLDADSDKLNSFDETDGEWLEKIVALIYA